jgi:hypothetical protein
MAKNKSTKNNSTVKKSSSKEQSVPLFKSIFRFIDERFKKIVGLFFVFIAIFLGISFYSFFTTWQVDQDKISSVHNIVQFLFSSDIQTQNTTGRLGAYLSHHPLFLYFFC